MQINVAQLLKEGTGAVRSFDVDDVLTLDEVSTGQELGVKGQVTLTRAARAILLKGTFTCQVQVACGRCLALFPHSASFNVEEMFYPSIDILTGLTLALPDEDVSTSFTIDEHHILDTSEMIRQYCLLAIPMKPLCRADCAGLCPDCGANLNENKCHCVPGQRTALAEALDRAGVLQRVKATGRAGAQGKPKGSRRGKAPDGADGPGRARVPDHGKTPDRAKSRRKMG